MPKLTASYKLNEEQLKQLKQIVPEAFKDNILDFNSLYEALSDFLEDDENTELEQFGLSWPGKRQAKRAAAIPPIGTLVPVPGDGVDEDTTKNIYIEGDNLEVLKILKKAYTGRIKMIYIDPPYNTGSDFIYPDYFSETVESFQRRTGQLNENNEKMTTNNRSDGRFHSKWLSMMLPRLMLARELLKEDGVIFISIDDNEVTQLRKICDEIFGEENFISQLVWQNKKGGGNDSLYIAVEHEYILVYAKSKMELNEFYELYSDSYIMRYKEEDVKGKYFWDTFKRKSGKQYYPIECPDGTILEIDNDGNPISWLRSKNRFELDKSDGEVRIIKINNKWSVQFKQRMPEGKKPRSIFYTEGVITDKGTTSTGADDVYNLFKKDVFSNPKPIELLKFLLSFGAGNDEIILDFFSGSATMCDAIMNINAFNNDKKKYIVVQLKEDVDKMLTSSSANAKRIAENAISILDELCLPHFITEIGKERIRRAGKKIKEDAGLNAANLDTGFKVYRLAPSNYKAWENYGGTDVKQLEELFKADSLMQGWKEDDLLTEIMLLEGFPLDSKIELLSKFKKNKIKKISSDFRDNALYICLDKGIAKETIETLNLTDKGRFICLDSAIDDQSKIRLEDKNLIKTL